MKEMRAGRGRSPTLESGEATGLGVLSLAVGAVGYFNVRRHVVDAFSGWIRRRDDRAPGGCRRRRGCQQRSYPRDRKPALDDNGVSPEPLRLRHQRRVRGQRPRVGDRGVFGALSLPGPDARGAAYPALAAPPTGPPGRGGRGPHQTPGHRDHPDPERHAVRDLLHRGAGRSEHLRPKPAARRRRDHHPGSRSGFRGAELSARHNRRVLHHLRGAVQRRGLHLRQPQLLHDARDVLRLDVDEVPDGTMQGVTNYVSGQQRFNVEMQLSDAEAVPRVLASLDDAKELYLNPPRLVEREESGGRVRLRILAGVLPSMAWLVEENLTERIKAAAGEESLAAQPLVYKVDQANLRRIRELLPQEAEKNLPPEAKRKLDRS